MIPLEEALEIVLRQVLTLPDEKVDLLSSPGRVLAEDIWGEFDIPAFHRAAMDGYAIMARDTISASKTKPVILKVAGELAAGGGIESKVRPGQAIRIMTGAPMPEGADAVVMMEDTDSEGEKVKIFKCIREGENVSFAGEDVKKGEKVLSRGTLIRPQEVGMLAALGRREVRVTQKPRVAIISTGDEVLEPGEKLEIGKIYDSNSFALFSQVRASGGEPQRIGIVRDDPEELLSVVQKAVSSCDILLLSGGVSEGKYDLVKQVLEEAGVKILFWKVATKPGKPTLFGIKGNKLVFGLPGYPVSSMMNFENLVKPAIFKMLGHKEYKKKFKIKAILKEEVKNSSGRKNFIRVRLVEEDGKYWAIPAPSQKSGVLKSMLWANGIVVMAENVKKLRAGDEVVVEVLG